MKALLPVLAMCVSVSALGANLTIVGSSGVSLKDSSATRVSEADFQIVDGRIDAKNGIRADEGGASFAPSAPLLLAHSFVVRSVKGEEYRLMVHAVSGENHSIEIVPIKDRLGAARVDVSGLYRPTSFAVNGVPGNPSLRDLRIDSGGTYRFGSASGHWSKDDDSLALEGAYGAWGRGEVAPDGSTITFHYVRASLEFEVVLTRAPSEVAAAGPAAR